MALVAQALLPVQRKGPGSRTHSQEWLCHRLVELSRAASLFEGLLEARDFVLQARDAARDGKVVDEKDGPDGEIGDHQAIEIFHFASPVF